MTTANERGVVTGLNEFVGYSGVTLGSLFSAYLAVTFGLRPLPFIIGFGIIGFALLVAVFLVEETQYHTIKKQTIKNISISDTRHHGFVKNVKFILLNKTLLVIAQAGHVEKNVDALV
jgi:MFS family permease